MHIEPIRFWRWIESGLEWNVSICVIACLQFHPTSATIMQTVNVQGFGKDMPTSRSYHVIGRGHAHILLSQSTLQNYSADAIKSELKPVQAVRIQSRSDPIAVRTGLNILVAWEASLKWGRSYGVRQQAVASLPSSSLRRPTPSAHKGIVLKFTNVQFVKGLIRLSNKWSVHRWCVCVCVCGQVDRYWSLIVQ